MKWQLLYLLNRICFELVTNKRHSGPKQTGDSF